MLRRRKVDVCCLQETKYKGGSCRVIGDGKERYKFFWVNEDSMQGVGVMVHYNLVENVLEVQRVCGRIMVVKIVLGKEVFNVISAYAPQVGRSSLEKEEFYERLMSVVRKLPLGEKVFIGGDLNGHIGNARRGFEDVLGIHGYGTQNSEGVRILEFAQAMELQVVNSFFKKKPEGYVTYKSGECKTQLDLILMKKQLRKTVRNLKVFAGEECVTQHRLVIVDLMVKVADRKEKKMRKPKKIKTWRLKNPEVKLKFEKEVAEKLKTARNDSDVWKIYEETIVQTAKEVCGETNGVARKRNKETWWWNCSVQTAIAEKKAAFKKWQKSGAQEDKQEYRRMKQEAKRQVAIAKEQASEKWAEELETLEGRKKIFQIARQMKKENQDVMGAKFVKDRKGEMLMHSTDVLRRWGEYFEELMNEKNDFEVDEVHPIEGPIKEVDKNEVRQAIEAMKTGKAAGPTGLTTEMMKAGGESSMIEFTKVLADVWKKEKIPEEWKRSLTVAIYKGKGDPLQCNSYRGIRLLEHPMKVMEKVLEKRLREIVNIDEMQRGFMKGRSTTDAIHVLRQLQEKYLEKKKTLFHVFMDLEKAFDRVPREVVVWALRRQGVPEKLIALVMSLYEDSSSCVRRENEDSKNFPISVGVHQGSALSPLLFIVVMEEVSKECRCGAPWEMLFADDLVLTADSEDKVKDMFLKWRNALEKRGLKINVSKTKLLVSGDKIENEETGRYPCAVCRKGVGSSSIQCSKCTKWVHKRCSGMRTLTNMARFACRRCTNSSESGRSECRKLGIGDEYIEKVDRFCYLGDMVSSGGDNTDAIRTRVKAVWNYRVYC